MPFPPANAAAVALAIVLFAAVPAQAADDASVVGLYTEAIEQALAGKEETDLALASIREVPASSLPAFDKWFAANAHRMQRELLMLELELRRGLTPLAEQPFLTLHDGFQYFEARFGLSGVARLLIEPERPASARHISEIRSKINALGPVCVFGEAQYNGRILTAVTENTEARIGRLDGLGNALEPGPGLYAALLQGLAKDFAACLSGGE